MVLITYRPEYHGALATIPGAQTISLRPLNTEQTEALIGELLGTDASVHGLAEVIAERADGNPFFAEEIVRDLAERGAVRGTRGSYLLHGDVADATVPATLQAVIAARVDRLSPAAKRTLNAAAVVGSRFSPELLTALGIDPILDELVAAELIDQIGFTPKIEYVFRHPLIRAVAYESQLKSDRAELHQRLAAAIEQRGSADENAALIAEHLRAAGNLHAAFDWYMRAGTWLTHRDITAARASWRHAQDVADRLPDSDTERAAMRIAPRTLLCASAWLAGGSLADTGFDELRDLADDAGDKVSLAMGMGGQLPALIVHARIEEASRLASELSSLLESIGDPTLTLGLLYSALPAKYERAEMTEVVQLAQRMIDLADGDANKGNFIISSPLAGAIMFRGCARCYLGDPGWRADVEQSTTMVRAYDPTMRALMLLFKYALIANGVWLPDAAAVQETAELLEVAERSGDNLTLACARQVHALANYDAPHRQDIFALLAAVREAALQERYTLVAAMGVDTWLADEKARAGDVDGAIELSRVVVEQMYACGEVLALPKSISTLVSALMSRGDPMDLSEAQSAIDRLAAVPTEPGFVMNDLWLLRMRALEAQARADESAYRDYRDRYRAMANSLGFEGTYQMGIGNGVIE